MNIFEKMLINEKWEIVERGKKGHFIKFKKISMNNVNFKSFP